MPLVVRADKCDGTRGALSQALRRAAMQVAALGGRFAVAAGLREGHEALRLDLPRPLLFNPFSLFVTPFPLVHTPARICAETTPAYDSRQPRVCGCPTGF